MLRELTSANRETNSAPAESEVSVNINILLTWVPVCWYGHESISVLNLLAS